MSNVQVVVIDDDKNVRWALQEVLSIGEINYASAGSGSEGLKLIAMYRPSLAIVDVKLGAMSGLDVARQIPGISKETSILFITGYSEAIRDKLDEYVNVAGVIEKPFNVADLLEFVHKILKTKRKHVS